VKNTAITGGKDKGILYKKGIAVAEFSVLVEVK
jgi:hypothetical protein